MTKRLTRLACFGLVLTIWSQCRKKYDARWQPGLRGRCPNFIPTKKERAQLNLTNTTLTYEVYSNPRQAYHRYITKYESLAELWTIFNEEYLYADFPRLMIRAEDTYFYPKQLMELISDCSGVPLKRDAPENKDGFHYMAQKSKEDSTTNWLQAMETYGREQGRFSSTLTAVEKQYLQHALSPTLMRLLHYPQVPVGKDPNKKSKNVK